MKSHDVRFQQATDNVEFIREPVRVLVLVSWFFLRNFSYFIWISNYLRLRNWILKLRNRREIQNIEPEKVERLTFVHGMLNKDWNVETIGGQFIFKGKNQKNRFKSDLNQINRDFWYFSKKSDFLTTQFLNKFSKP